MFQEKTDCSSKVVIVTVVLDSFDGGGSNIGIGTLHRETNARRGGARYHSVLTPNDTNPYLAKIKKLTNENRGLRKLSDDLEKQGDAQSNVILTRKIRDLNHKNKLWCEQVTTNQKKMDKLKLKLKIKIERLTIENGQITKQIRCKYAKLSNVDK